MPETPQPSNQETASFYQGRQYADLLHEAGGGRDISKKRSDVLDMPKDMRTNLPEDPGEVRALNNEAASKYAERFPDQLQAVAIMAEFAPMAQLQHNLEVAGKLQGRERSEAFRDMTEFQFLLTNFALNNVDDAEGMKAFWDSMFETANKTGNHDIAARIKTGVLSTVATMKCLEAIGAKPTLSHPREDAYNAIDIFAGGRAVQVKRGHRGEKMLYTTDDLDFPGPEIVNEDGSVSHFSADIDRGAEKDLMTFRRKVEDYSRDIGREVKGYFIRLPYDKTEPDTGKPTEELIAQVRQEFGDAIRRRQAPRATAEAAEAAAAATASDADELAARRRAQQEAMAKIAAAGRQTEAAEDLSRAA